MENKVCFMVDCTWILLYELNFTFCVILIQFVHHSSLHIRVAVEALKECVAKECYRLPCGPMVGWYLALRKGNNSRDSCRIDQSSYLVS